MQSGIDQQKTVNRKIQNPLGADRLASIDAQVPPTLCKEDAEAKFMDDHWLCVVESIRF